MNELGKWITNGTKHPFYARKYIEITKVVKKATAKVCGLGQFNFYINGKKVKDHVLDPGWTNYEKRIQYVTFDITKDLVTGGNVIGAEVGNGWFIKDDTNYTFHFPPFMPPNPNPYRPFGSSLVLAVKLEIEYTDGTTKSMTADHTFKVKEHPVTVSNVYGSETIRGDLAQPGWNTVLFDDTDWPLAQMVKPQEEPKGRLEEQSQPPVKVINTYEGVRLHDTGKRCIYDLLQNMAGILEAEVCGRAGDIIRFYPAEKLTQEGDIDQMAKNWVMIDSCITYVIGQDDTWETCCMKFTYFAGRYIGVEGTAKIRSLKGHAITSAHVTHGRFRCDDKRFMQIYDMVEKTVEANMVSVHTDCPTIERFAWQEPNHLMAPSIMYMKDSKALWEKFLADMRTDQLTEETFFLDMEQKPYYPGAGLMPSQCPCYLPNVLPVPGLGSFYDIIPWGSTCILGTWWHYQFYGDEKIIEDNYDAGMRYLKHLKTKVNGDGFINHGLGDWGHPNNDLVRENIETVFLYADAVILAKFAEVLGYSKDKKKLEDYAAAVKENYNKKLLVKHPVKDFYCYRAWDHEDEIFLTQASQALPLYWGLVPEDKEEAVVAAFRDTLEMERSFLSGEVGLPYIIQTACRYGMNELICKYILKEEHPSYYAFILDGETTLGEYWEKNPRSHCHDMMGHIIEWYYNGMAGIIPEEPGFEKLTIRPYLPESMNEFTCSYQSVRGLIQVWVKRMAEGISIDVQVPQEVTYRIDRSQLKEGTDRCQL